MVVLQTIAQIIIGLMFFGLVLGIWDTFTTLIKRHNNLKKFTEEDYRRWKIIEYKGMI